MNPDVIQFATFGLVVVVLVAYGLFIRWRIKVHRVRRTDESATVARTETQSSSRLLADGPVGGPTVMDALAGIAMPCDLVPHPDASARDDAADRIALITGPMAVEDVRAAVSGALQAIGYELTWQAAQAVARRGGDELRVDLYERAGTVRRGEQLAFPVAPEGAFVVDVWIPAS